MAAPSVSLRAPFSGQTGVSRSANIFFRVSGPSGVTLSSLTVQVQLVLNSIPQGFQNAILAGVVQTGFNGPSSALVAVMVGPDSGFDVTIDRTVNFPINAEIQVRIDASSTLAEAMTQDNYSFVVTSVDAVAPTIINRNPNTGQTNVLIGTNIAFTVADDDGGAGVAVKKLKAFINGAVAYDGAESTVLENTPSTWQFGFLGDFQGAVVSAQQQIGVGTASPADSFSDTLVIPPLTSIIPGTVSVRKNGTGTPGSGTEVAIDNGLGVITGVNVTGSINYSTGAITVTETGHEWLVADTVDIDYQTFGSSIVLSGQNVVVSVDPNVPLGDGETITVSVQASDKQNNAAQTTYTFVTEDLSAPEVSNRTPPVGEDDASKSTNISFSLSDNLDGVNIKTLVVTVDGATAYDGTLMAVIEATPSTWVLGFVAGFNGPASSIVVNATLGYNVVIDKTTDFTVYDEVTVAITVSDKHSPPNALSTSYQFNVSAPGNLHEIRIYGGVVGHSKVEFFRTGTSTKDHEEFASEVRVELPSTEYVAVTIRPGVDVIVGQAYDLKLSVGPLNATLVWNGTTKGVRFVA